MDDLGLSIKQISYSNTRMLAKVIKDMKINNTINPILTISRIRMISNTVKYIIYGTNDEKYTNNLSTHGIRKM